MRALSSRKLCSSNKGLAGISHNRYFCFILTTFNHGNVVHNTVQTSEDNKNFSECSDIRMHGDSG